MTTRTQTLAEFLLARIAEDERDANRDPGGDPIPSDCWGPDRVLAECEAKRRIVEEQRWEPNPGMECGGHPGPYMPHGDYGEGYCFDAARHNDDTNRVFQWLALPYADHPDYRQEWRP